MIAVYALLAVIVMAIASALLIVTGASVAWTLFWSLVVFVVAALLLGLAAGGADVATRAGRSR